MFPALCEQSEHEHTLPKLVNADENGLVSMGTDKVQDCPAGLSAWRKVIPATWACPCRTSITMSQDEARGHLCMGSMMQVIHQLHRGLVQPCRQLPHDRWLAISVCDGGVPNALPGVGVGVVNVELVERCPRQDLVPEHDGSIVGLPPKVASVQYPPERAFKQEHKRALQWG